MEQEHEKRAAALAGLLCAALSLAFVPVSRADEPPQPNAPAVQAAEAPANRQDDGKRFVLTRSGEIVEGRLRDGGSAYLLEFDKGGSTLVSKLDALFIGKSRKDVFQYKLSQTRTEDLNEVLKLTDWASRRKLAPEAIELLESRLASTRDPGERNAITRKLEDLRQAEAFRQGAARFAAEREAREALEAQKTEAAANKPLDPQHAEIEAWSKGIPFPSIERFGRRVNPILQKRCAQADCHAPGSESRYVVRPKGVGTAARLALLYNLRETLDYVNFDDVQRSPILIHPEITDAKGNRAYPFGNERSSLRDCETFVKWIESLPAETVLAKYAAETRRDHSGPLVRRGGASRYDVVDGPAGAPTAFDAVNPGANVPSEPFGELFKGEQGAGQTAPAEGGALSFGVSPEAAKYMPNPADDPNSEDARLQRVGIEPQRTYRDDYDPEIFNDRYHPKN